MKKVEVNLSVIEDLAGKGYTAAMIFDAVGISTSKGYHDTQIKQAIKTGHAKAKQKVVNDLMTRSENDQSSTASIYLSNKLKIYDEYFPTASP